MKKANRCKCILQTGLRAGQKCDANIPENRKRCGRHINKCNKTLSKSPRKSPRKSPKKSPCAPCPPCRAPKSPYWKETSAAPAWEFKPASKSPVKSPYWKETSAEPAWEFKPAKTPSKSPYWKETSAAPAWEFQPASFKSADIPEGPSWAYKADAKKPQGGAGRKKKAAMAAGLMAGAAILGGGAAPAGAFNRLERAPTDQLGCPSTNSLNRSLVLWGRFQRCRQSHTHSELK